jgi:hypothetical protein
VELSAGEGSIGGDVSPVTVDYALINGIDAESRFGYIITTGRHVCRIANKPEATRTIH